MRVAQIGEAEDSVAFRLDYYLAQSFVLWAVERVLGLL